MRSSEAASAGINPDLFNDGDNLRYTFDVYNVTNTSSIDITRNNVIQNFAFNNVPFAVRSTQPFRAPSARKVTSRLSLLPLQKPVPLRVWTAVVSERKRA